MTRRRDLLAVQTIVVTFVAALRAIARTPDRDRRVIMAEHARDRALALLSAADLNIPYVVGSPLDRAMREARRRIEQASVDE